ncbi:hypothetical protein FP2506_02240 [Fulvimarina pelagi HTCC2506]|uniref:Uncharacterized protein n=2 Tax=Fulvimarina pelagi TaxID=217511 RepID=Q0FYH2_9HYPH|nr:hypothetical protein [Fulvimarina pelagi]EAU40023.1 hypothetical protein FP2506_02240 [Fulvimarina pelagi HTCC2506]BAT31064.1 hypothetical protein [Fulvimarina pelagi]
MICRRKTAVLLTIAGTLISLAGCSGTGEDNFSEGGTYGYPYEGRWDCEVETFSFTASSYDNGSQTFEVTEVQEGTDGSYTLFFGDGELITLSNISASQMGWYSHQTGDSFSCNRLT